MSHGPIADARRGRSERGLRALFAPVDPASLVAFRVAFGLLMVVLVARYFAHGWIDAQFHEPSMFFPWPGFEWVRPWPRPFMHVHFAALAGLALAVAAGFHTRVAAALFCAGFSWIHAIDRTLYLNHYYLISLVSLLLCVSPVGRAGSLDVKLGRVAPLAAFPAWTIALLRFQVGVVYFYAGVAKLQPDWLLRAQPMRIWMASVSDAPFVGAWLGSSTAAFAASWAGAAFDLAVPFLLLWPAARPLAFAALVIFHVFTALLFPIGLFPWLMIVCATIFLPPDWPRRVLRSGRAPRAADPRRDLPTRWWVAPALAAWVAIQACVPLRHLWRPGDVLWTEEGFRFSWKVMLVEKAGQARFSVHELRSGRRREVPMAERLTPAQLRAVTTQPDLARAFARRLASELEGAGVGPVEVYAEVFVSSNGRPARRVFDPSLDLAQQAPVQDLAEELPRPRVRDGAIARAQPELVVHAAVERLDAHLDRREREER